MKGQFQKMIRPLIIILAVAGLSGCYPVAGALLYGGAEATSKNYTDKWLIEHFAEWAGKNCENIVHYESPPRCRNEAY